MNLCKSAAQLPFRNHRRRIGTASRAVAWSLAIVSLLLAGAPFAAHAAALSLVAPTEGMLNPAWYTAGNVVSLAGTAPAGTTSVVWKNRATGETGVAEGTTVWRADRIPLTVGTNNFLITAHSAAGTTTLNVIVGRVANALAQITLIATEDATVHSAEPNQSFGSSNFLFIGHSPEVGNQRALVKFDLATVPAGIVVDYAWLVLNQYPNPQGAGPSFKITGFRPLEDWDEETIMWNTQPPRAMNPISTTQTPFWDNLRLDWNVTAIVRSWLDDSEPNYGIKLISDIEDAAVTSVRRFGSREGTNAPELHISYIVEHEPPVIAITAPSTAVLFTTSNSSVQFAGTATDNSGLASVRWKNLRTSAQADAHGLASWDAAVNVVIGLNPLVVTATDIYGNEAHATIFVQVEQEDTTPPSAPTNVTVTALADIALYVAWGAATDAGRGVAGYAVYRDGVYLTNTIWLHYSDLPLAPDSSHCYVIVAIDGAGNTNAAAPVCGATPACIYGVGPQVISVPATGGVTNVWISTSNGCAWTVGTVPFWCSIAATGGMGSAKLPLTVEPNPESQPRTAQVSIAGTFVTISQAALVDPSCTVTLSATSLAFSRNGGTQTVNVVVSGSNSQFGCSWVLQSAPEWVYVAPESGASSGTITLLVLCNSQPGARSGAVLISGIELAVHQLPGDGSDTCVGSVSNAINFALESAPRPAELRRLRHGLSAMRVASASTVPQDARLLRSLSAALKGSESPIVSDGLADARQCVTSDLRTWHEVLAQRLRNLPVSHARSLLESRLDRAAAALDRGAASTKLSSATYALSDAANRLRSLQRTLDRRDTVP